MSNRAERLTREELMEAMEVNWGRYLPTVNVLTEEEQLAYARANGYDDLTSLILHLNATFQRALDVVPRLAQGADVPDADWTLDPVHDQVVMTDRQTLDQIEQDFDSLSNAVGGMMADLPLAALDNERVYNWLYGVAVEHYLAHQPPGEPQTPSAQHTQIRPEPGDHAPTDEDAPPYAGYSRPGDRR